MLKNYFGLLYNGYIEVEHTLVLVQINSYFFASVLSAEWSQS